MAYADAVSDGIALAVQEDVNIRGPEGHVAFGVAWVDADPTCREIPRTFSFGWQVPPLMATPIPTRLDGEHGVFVAGIPRLIPGPHGAMTFGYLPAGNYDELPETLHRVDVANAPDTSALPEGWTYSRNEDGEKHGLQIWKSSTGVGVGGVLRGRGALVKSRLSERQPSRLVPDLCERQEARRPAFCAS